MKKTLSLLLALCILATFILTSCDNSDLFNKDDTDSTYASGDNTGSGSYSDTATAQPVDSEQTDIPEDLPSGENTLEIKCTSGTDNCWSVSGKALTFSGLTADTVCTVTGNFDGQIKIDAGEGYKFDLQLCGVTLYSDSFNPIEIVSGDTVTISAQSGTQNYIYDKRAAISDSDTTSHSAAIYADCDLDLKGSGTLTVISSANNGIHSKDNLTVKNINLSVTCIDNALKGNDKVEIKSGSLVLISKSGDGIKTDSTELSEKGNQKGTVTISGGQVDIYAACDGIDAAYNAEISDSAVLNIYTDQYSEYSGTVESPDTSGNVRYIRFSSKNYSYSVKYYNSDSDYVWKNATLAKTVSGGRSTYYYYSFDIVDGYKSVQIYIYSSSQKQGQSDDYVACTDYMTWNTAYDTFAIASRGSSLGYNWTNYTSEISDGLGGMGGMGGMGGDGNSDKSTYSTKGIKAGNEIIISGGTIYVKSYDDAIHANNESTLENGKTPTGNVTISGGTLTLFSNDDGVHGDGTVTVNGGKITVTNSYEGIEGVYITVNGGEISVISTDDGFNATTTSGVGLTINDGNIYVYAGGDGLDSNSRTSYQGILFAGGVTKVISTSGGNSCIDTEQGYKYTGGTVLAMCPSNGMGSESTKCSNFSSVGTKTTMSLKQNQVLTVKVNSKETVSVTMPCALSALVVYLGSSSAKFST